LGAGQVCTIFNGYLAYGTTKIGMIVEACFRTENPTNTILDIYWIPETGKRNPEKIEGEMT
jgi:hypothetical protein